MPAIIAGIAAGGSLASSYFGGKQKKKQRRRHAKAIQRALSGEEAIRGAGLGQQEALSRQATQQQLHGYDVARQEGTRLGRGSKRRAIEREQQLGGQLSQNLQNRGLSSTTTGGNLQRGLAGDTTRQLSDIDEGLSGFFGDLALGRAGTEAQGTQDLAGLSQQRTDLASMLNEQRNLQARGYGGFGTQLEGLPPSGAENVFGAIGTGIGVYGGMGGGMDFGSSLQKLFGMGGGGQYKGQTGGGGVGGWS